MFQLNEFVVYHDEGRTLHFFIKISFYFFIKSQICSVRETDGGRETKTDYYIDPWIFSLDHTMLCYFQGPT